MMGVIVARVNACLTELQWMAQNHTLLLLHRYQLDGFILFPMKQGRMNTQNAARAPSWYSVSRNQRKQFTSFDTDFISGYGITCLIRGNVRTETERLTGKSGWCSGYHDRLTRDRSRVQSPHPILFHFLSLFTHSFHSSFITKHTTLSKQTPHYNNKVLDAS